MRLTILGCYSATPRTLTNPSAQVLEMRGHLFLIDCGEGTQVELRRNKIKFSRINHVFISHLHGDHFFGLPGLVSTFRLLGRESPLHIYGPKGIREAITLLLKLGDSWTTYPLHFHELTSKQPQEILDLPQLKVSTIPLDHRVYTNGFYFTEKPKERGLDIKAAKARGIDQAYFSKLKQGQNVSDQEGREVNFEDVTTDPPPTKSYAYCSDTAYNERLIPWIEKADVLYHESTFLESESHLCERTKHSTAKQAALIAKKGEVKQLILGHYSTRYKSLEPFRAEAQEVFENTQLAEDGKTFTF